jgi:type IV fimbrial biogenesis protein FimT
LLKVSANLATTQARFTKQAGFTLVELMVVIAIVGIGLTVALPDLGVFMRRNQISSGTNDLLTAVSLARTEAVKRSVPTVVCASADGINCAAATANWSVGYIVFADVNGDGARQPGTEELATVGTAFSAGIAVQSFGGAGLVRFAPNGLMAGGSAGVRFEIRHPASAITSENRYVCVARVGRANAMNYTTYTTDPRFVACGAL